MLKIEYVPVNRLKEYENNPRNNDLAIEKVAASIKRLGFLFPIIIDINYVIVCGHTRKRACELVGIKNVPCIRVEHLSQEQINYFRLVDNRTSEYASWDFTKFESELKLINLEVVENYLLLEQFELDAEITDLDCKMDEIKVESFNSADSYKSLLERYFEQVDVVDVTSGYIYCIAKNPKRLACDKVENAISEEFNIEYPGGFKHNRHKGLVSAIMQEVRKRNGENG